MGDKYRTQQNLEIVGTDVERGLIFVKGSVPGSKGGWLFVKDSIKIDRPADAPFPAGIRDPKHGEEHVVMSVEEGAVHPLPHDPSAEEVAAGVAAADEHGAGQSDAEINGTDTDTTGQEG
jgi:large subunit ribosomal protein L3